MLSSILALAIVPVLSLEPGTRQPQLAAQGQRVALTYGVGNDVFATVSTDGGHHFPKAVRIGNAGKLSLGRHRGPRVAVASGAIVVAAIAGEQGGGKDGEVYVWRSTDNGRTWSGSQRVNDVPGAAREGLHALAAGPDGMVVAAWLDLRQKGMRVMASLSRDSGATWSPNFLVYASPSGNVCECCHPSAAIAADGTIHILFRNWLNSSRDMWLASSRDGGKSFSARVMGAGTWKLNACPMDGGGVAVRKDGSVATVWRREQSILSTDGDKFIDSKWTGKDPAIAMDDTGQRVLAWTEGTRLVVFDGALREIASQGGYPALAATGSAVLLAWEQPGGVRVAKLR